MDLQINYVFQILMGSHFFPSVCMPFANGTCISFPLRYKFNFVNIDNVNNKCNSHTIYKHSNAYLFLSKLQSNF